MNNVPPYLSAQPCTLRIVRSGEEWQVLTGDSILVGCLASLARELGYRVTSLSDEIGISEQHLRRIFHRDVGISVREWMREKRMVFAEKLLVSGMGVPEIGNALGFSHVNCFRREFIKIRKLTPSRFLILQKGTRDGSVDQGVSQ